MTKLMKSAVLAAAGAAALAVSALPASAAIVCNRDHECWHVRGRYAYRHEFGVVVHPDSWRWNRHEHYVWREHDGRGYWRHGVWIQF
jgi:hypothetical protein